MADLKLNVASAELFLCRTRTIRTLDRIKIVRQFFKQTEFIGWYTYTIYTKFRIQNIRKVPYIGKQYVIGLA